MSGPVSAIWPQGGVWVTGNNNRYSRIMPIVTAYQPTAIPTIYFTSVGPSNARTYHTGSTQLAQSYFSPVNGLFHQPAGLIAEQAGQVFNTSAIWRPTPVPFTDTTFFF